MNLIDNRKQKQNISTNLVGLICFTIAAGDHAVSHSIFNQKAFGSNKNNNTIIINIIFV